MQVFTARSCETYDMEYLCNELKEQIEENVAFCSRSLGIVVCDSTIDYANVMRRLSEIFDFTICGCTALAFIRIGTVEDISVSFMVITGDEELIGSTVLTKPMTNDNHREVIAEAYHVACEQLGSAPKMAISLQPYSASITADIATEVLDAASNHLPIYGAVASNDLSSNISGVFLNGVLHKDCLLLNLLGGGINPQFAVAYAKLDIPARRSLITKSENNIVYKVGDDTFLEFMKKSGLIIEPSYVTESFIATYTSSPVLVWKNNSERERRKARNIIHIDYETGAVAFTGAMPEGYEVAISLLRRDDVIKSSIACFEEITAKIEANTTEQYKYSTLFSTSCGGRYLIMSGDTSIEGNFINNTPALASLATCGFFAMGEICPSAVDDSGVATNGSYHTAITVMAL